MTTWISLSSSHPKHRELHDDQAGVSRNGYINADHVVSVEIVEIVPTPVVIDKFALVATMVNGDTIEIVRHRTYGDAYGALMRLVSNVNDNCRYVAYAANKEAVDA